VTSRRLVLLALVVLFALRHDLWWWNADDRVLGLPIGLAWHVLLCVAVALTMALFARVGESDSGDES
jgi:hypothetical protein